MPVRNFRFVGGIAIFTLMAGLALAQKAQSEGVVTSNYKQGGYKAPRAQDGHADLQGVWSNNSANPLQRPKEFEGREHLTEQEVAGLKKAADAMFQGGASDAAFGDQVFLAALANYLGKQKGFVTSDGKTGDYSSAWTIQRDWTNQTSHIIDPKDGRLPEMTAQAKELSAQPSYVEGSTNGKRPDSYEDIALSVRCITRGVPYIMSGYNSYLQIFQTQNTVVIQQEMIHTSRIVHLEGSHPPANIQFRQGDSRGHWDGDTLVVDTTNFKPNSITMGLTGAPISTDKLHIVERFQRTAPDYITWTLTFDDPAVWSRPWTAEIPIRRTDDPIFEFACHEGNYGLAGILAGARAEDAEEARRPGAK
jgi:hypothetical protein